MITLSGVSRLKPADVVIIQCHHRHALFLLCPVQSSQAGRNYKYNELQIVGFYQQKSGLTGWIFFVSSLGVIWQLFSVFSVKLVASHQTKLNLFHDQILHFLLKLRCGAVSEVAAVNSEWDLTENHEKAADQLCWRAKYSERAGGGALPKMSALCYTLTLLVTQWLHQ